VRGERPLLVAAGKEKRGTEKKVRWKAQSFAGELYLPSQPKLNSANRMALTDDRQKKKGRTNFTQQFKKKGLITQGRGTATAIENKWRPAPCCSRRREKGKFPLQERGGNKNGPIAEKGEGKNFWKSMLRERRRHVKACPVRCHREEKEKGLRRKKTGG